MAGGYNSPMFGYMLGGPTIGGGVSTMGASIIAEDAIKNAELRVQALELTCAALWTILKEKNGLTDEDLVRAIHEVDARDGTVDGKISHVAKECPRCHRKLLTRNPTKCAWCGGELSPLGAG